MSKPEKVVAADGHVYHKSATANAPVAPTNEATLENAGKTKGLSNDQAQFVTIIDYEWSLKGNIDPAFIKEEYGYLDDEWEELVSNESCIKALDERGIAAKFLGVLEDTDEITAPLTPVQLIAANSLLDLTDNRSTKKKLQDLGVSSYKYQSWLKDPVFRDYLRKRAENMLGSLHHEAALALTDKVMAGDMKALEFWYEMQGIYTKASSTNSGPQVQDLQQIIVKIIEIVLEEVEDQSTALRISDRLKMLVMGNQVAGVITAEPVTIPEIAAPRELTPEVQEMINKGYGVNS